MSVCKSTVKSCFRQMYPDGRSDHNVRYAVGEKCCGSLVTQIEYHEPMGEGDQHYCDIYYDDGDVVRMFRPDFITFELESEEKE